MPDTLSIPNDASDVDSSSDCMMLATPYMLAILIMLCKNHMLAILIVSYT